jgi:ABC-type polysaccharide/polyol phosphate transport system ATPase subunit
MAVRSTFASRGPRASGDCDVAAAAEGMSKSYPRVRRTQFVGVTSVWRRGGDAPDFADDVFDDDDDDLDVDDEQGEPESAGGPVGETFWALRRISFRVRAGSSLGVVGAAGSGKTTLLRILGGLAFPTEGRVIVRGRVSPVAAGLAAVLRGKGSTSLVEGCQLVGIESGLVRRHIDEILDLARPGEGAPGAHGEPDPGASLRLAVATAVALPWSVILLDELPRTDEDFTQRVVERVRERVRGGAALVLASRRAELVRMLCDDAIWLEAGTIIGAADADGVAGRYEAAVRRTAQDGADSRGSAGRIAAGPVTAPARAAAQIAVPAVAQLRIPAVPSPFDERAALLSAAVHTPRGVNRKVIDAADELSVEIQLETAVPDVEARCGVTFSPRSGEPGIRLELPQPLRFSDPGSYVLVARTIPGTLRSGVYDIRADAIVADGSDQPPSVIARDIRRSRIVGDELEPERPGSRPTAQWDGREAWPAEAEWSVQ